MIPSLARPILKHWPWWALAVSLAVLAGAHAFETFGRLAPCELCLKQRGVYWAAVGAATGGVLVSLIRPAFSRAVCALLALIFLGGAVLAAYHAGVEWRFWEGPKSCTGGHVQVTAADMARLLRGGPIGAPACDKAAWRMAGLSMAGWNVLISLGLTAASALAAGLKPAEAARS